MENHLIQDHLASVLHPQRDHGETVAYKNDIDAGGIGHMGAREVVGGDHGDGLPGFVQGSQIVERDFLPADGGRRAQRRV